MWKTILVPYEFSAGAEHAAQIAADEARAHGARVVLLHVVEMMPQFGRDSTMMVPPGTTTPVSVRRHYMETAEAQLRAVAAKLAADGVDVSVQVRAGVPVEEISAFVREHPVDVVIMGTHGRTGLRHALVGSVAERMVRVSTVPVMTIRHPEPA